MAIAPSRIATPTNNVLVDAIEKYIDEGFHVPSEVKHRLTIDPKYEIRRLARDAQKNYRFAITSEQPNEHEVDELRERYLRAGWFELRYFPDNDPEPGRPAVGYIVLTRMIGSTPPGPE